MKKILVVVDYQVDFVNGSLGFKGAEKIEQYIVSRIKAYEKANQEVIFTLDNHDKKKYMNTVEGKKLPVYHCVPKTEGYRLFGRVEKLSKNHKIIIKHAFGSDKLIPYLQKGKYEYVELVGLVSSICVFSNAVAAKIALPNSKIVVKRKGTSSFDLEMQEKSFDVLKNLHIEVE